MSMDWSGRSYTQADAEAFQRKWDRRVRDCPQPACRRHRRCMYQRREHGECRMEARYPFTDEEVNKRVVALRALLRRRLAEVEAAREARAAEEARAEAEARKRGRRKGRSGSRR